MIRNRVACRLGGSAAFDGAGGYKFERIKRAKEEVRQRPNALPLLDLGVGEPDRAAAREICDALSREAPRPENRWYADNGIPELQEASAAFLERAFQVRIPNPRTGIIHGIGSKPIFAMLPLCFIDPGDVALVTVPGYPVLATHTRYLGGEVFPLPLREENGFLPDLTRIPAEVLRRSKLLYLNYPNNPTGAVASREFFERVVEFARRHQIVVVHDAAYGSIVHDEAERLSFLSVEGALEVGVEVHSFSKAYNMTGWRLGFLAGNEDIVKAYGIVKDNYDSGQFRAIQLAGVEALRSPQLIEANRLRYKRRMELLTAALRRVGFRVPAPRGTFYCYVPAPTGVRDGRRFDSGEAAADYLLRHGSISTVPWDDVGAYLRFSVTFAAQDELAEREVVEEVERRLRGLDLLFSA